MNGETPREVEMTIAEVLELASQALQRDKLDEAEGICDRVLEAWPDSPDALHFSGLIAFKRGEAELATALLARSLVLAPEHADFWNNFGNVLKTRGEITDAVAAYQRAIELRPEFSDAHNNLGVMASVRQDFTGAVDAYRRAIAFQPGHADAYLNLGSALEKLERLDESVEAYRAVIERRPGHPEAYGRLGSIFWKQGRKDEATDAIVRHTEINPGDPMSFVVLAGIFYDQGRHDESIEAYQKAVDIDPKDSYANSLLGIILNMMGREEEARDAWRKWSEADPANPVPLHLLSAGSGEAIPERAGDNFVVHVFDRFAESFDKKLKGLDYRAPQLVADALKSCVPEPDGSLEILDAGCGTGLCGPLLRPYALRLDGVDLSNGMLEKARARGGYDSLVAAELTAFISGKQDAYDAIISADTLCYFGRLEAVFSAAFNALRCGGYLIFTVEKTVSSLGNSPMTLEPSGRYTHTEKYVRSALSQAEFEIIQVTFTALRLEFFKPVDGMVVIARKPAAKPQ